MSDDPKRRKRRRMLKLRIDEISAVDAGAQAEIGEVLMKRRDDKGGGRHRRLRRRSDESREAFMARFMADKGMQEQFPDKAERKRAAEDAMAKRAALTTAFDGHTHLIALDFGSGMATSGTTDFYSAPDGSGHAHPWVMGEDGTITIGTADGHEHAVATVSKASDEGAADPSHTADSAGDDTAADEGSMTTKNEDQAADKAADDTLRKERDEAVAKAARFEAIAALPAEQRAHFDKLDAEAQTEFLAADEKARAAALAKAADANPVIYTDADGQEYRKSDDARLVTLAKRADADRAAAAKAAALQQDASFAKRADEDLGHLPGESAVRKQLVKAVTLGVDDETQREAIFTMLKAHDRGIAALTERHGTREPAPTEADGRLEQLAKQYARDHKVTFEKAYSEVISTPEGQQLLLDSPNGAV